MHFDGSQEEAVAAGRDLHEVLALCLVAAAYVGCLGRSGVAHRFAGATGKIDAHHDVAHRRYGEAHRVAQSHPVRRDVEGRLAAKGEWHQRARYGRLTGGTYAD